MDFSVLHYFSFELTSDNLRKTVLQGSKIYSDGLTKLKRAINEYDQALLQEVAQYMLGHRPST